MPPAEDSPTNHRLLRRAAENVTGLSLSLKALLNFLTCRSSRAETVHLAIYRVENCSAQGWPGFRAASGQWEEFVITRSLGLLKQPASPDSNMGHQLLTMNAMNRPRTWHYINLCFIMWVSLHSEVHLRAWFRCFLGFASTHNQ